MNVNHNKVHEKGFLKNKLKSLLTNHFASYFKPMYFDFPHLADTIRLYTRISLEKFNPFLVELLKRPTLEVQEMVLRVLVSCIHEFILYACLLSEPLRDPTLYRRFYREVTA